MPGLYLYQYLPGVQATPPTAGRDPTPQQHNLTPALWSSTNWPHHPPFPTPTGHRVRFINSCLITSCPLSAVLIAFEPISAWATRLGLGSVVLEPHTTPIHTTQISKHKHSYTADNNNAIQTLKWRIVR